MRTARILLAGIALLLLLCSSAALAADKSSDGKALYKENCRVCHDKGSPNGEYSPMTMIGDQWDTFFKTKLVSSHKNVIDPKHGGKPVLEVLTPEQIKAIQKFCVDHAADSEQPQTCG
jgi:mono/diheme cytochrome c family protein